MRGHVRVRQSTDSSGGEAFEKRRHVAALQNAMDMRLKPLFNFALCGELVAALAFLLCLPWRRTTPLRTKALRVAGHGTRSRRSESYRVHHRCEGRAAA